MVVMMGFAIITTLTHPAAIAIHHNTPRGKEDEREALESFRL